MVGLHYLKHAFDKSDEVVVNGWVENPYWQYFCGEESFRHQLPIDPSQMTRFRGRIGAEGCEYMLNLTVVAGVATQTVVKTSLGCLVPEIDGVVFGHQWREALWEKWPRKFR